MNKYLACVYVIPEDDRDRQIADGFVMHDQVRSNRIQVMPPGGGWKEVLKIFQSEYVRILRGYPQSHVVMLIDFDGRYDDRRAEFEEAIPPEVKQRVFVIGPKQTPETLKNELGKTFEQIGTSLADDCYADAVDVWGHEQLKHNDPDRQRLAATVRSILFGP